MTGGFLDVYTYITRERACLCQCADRECRAPRKNQSCGEAISKGSRLFTSSPSCAFALGILFTEWIRGPSSEADLCLLEADRLFLRGRRFSVFRLKSGLGMGYGPSNILVSFIAPYRVSFQESQQAQRGGFGDDHVYRQSPQRYRADIPLCRTGTPIRKMSSATTKSSSFSRSARR